MPLLPLVAAAGGGAKAGLQPTRRDRPITLIGYFCKVNEPHPLMDFDRNRGRTAKRDVPPAGLHALHR